MVGWYHSHPRAASHPSTLDIKVQIKQQKAHRMGEGGVEPFIGAIVSPYPHSQEPGISYFCVDYPRDRELAQGADPIAEGCLPMCVEVINLPPPPPPPPPLYHHTPPLPCKLTLLALFLLFGAESE